MLQKKRARTKVTKKTKAKSIAQINKGVIKKINENRYQIEGESVSYVLKGKGKIKVIKGFFNLSGYSIRQGEEVDFDYSIQDHPLFINTITEQQNETKEIIEIELDKRDDDTFIIDLNSNNTTTRNQSKSIMKGNYVSIPTEIDNLIEYNTLILTGKSNSGKSLFIPIIINRLFTSRRDQQICLIDCDTIHPVSCSQFAISLLLIPNPIMTNDTSFPKKAYKVVASLYQNDPSDINQFIQIVQFLIDKANNEIKCDYLIINPPGQNNEMYTTILFKLIQSDESNSDNESKHKVVLLVKNKSQNDKDNTLEEVLVNQASDCLTQILFGDTEKRSNDKDTIQNFAIDNDFKLSENNSLERKKLETSNTILSIYNEANDCNKRRIKISNILFCISDDCSSYLNILSPIDILQMFSNRHCVLLLSDKDQICYTKESINCLFLSQIKITQRNYLSIAKVISIDVNSNSLLLYTNYSSINTNDQRIILIPDNRIEKSMKEVKTARCQKYISNMLFPYSLIHSEEKREMNTLYLGRNSYNLI